MKKSIARIFTMFLIVLLLISIPIAYSLGKNSQQNINQAKPINDYPSLWADLPQGAILDSWGNGIKECTSWVAWRAWQDLRYKVDRWGEAKNWPDKAKEAGLMVDTNPAVNSAMVNTHFYPGHIMWVEKINDDGTVYISEYNADGHGRFDRLNVSTDYMVFIHFPKINRGF